VRRVTATAAHAPNAKPTVIVERRRLCLWFYYGLGWTAEEIATFFTIGKETVKRMIHNAKGRASRLVSTTVRAA